jgi:EmrB/QacA subfamily drug resistance transporter
VSEGPGTVAAPAADPIGEITERYRWVALGVVLIGTFMVILDTTIVTVALDPIGRDIGSPNGVEWIITAYLLAVGVVQPATGWLADRIGRKPVFLWSMVLFAGGSLACALSPNLGFIVCFRVLQGLGGGAMMPVGMAIIYEVFPPHRRGTAMGVWGIAAMAAPAIGPGLGGWLVTQFDWRWLFLVNVPIGVVGTVLGIRVLRNNGFREERPLDWTGTVIATVGVTALLLALSEGASWGWATPRTEGVLAFGVLALAVFAWWSTTRTDHPLIDLSMFRISIYSITIAVICLLTLSQYGRLVFIPLELESLRHLTPLHTGLILTPTAVGAAITMPIGGKLADRIGARIPVTLGLVPVAAATWYLGTLSPTSSEHWLMFWLFVSGVGFGLAMMPNTVAGLNSLPSKLIATGSATRQLCRQIFGSVAVAALTAIVASQLGGHITDNGTHTLGEAQAAYNDVFVWGFWALVATIVVALFLPGKERALALQRARAAESEAMASGSGAQPPVAALVDAEP